MLYMCVCSLLLKTTKPLHLQILLFLYEEEIVLLPFFK